MILLLDQYELIYGVPMVQFLKAVLDRFASEPGSYFIARAMKRHLQKMKSATHPEHKTRGDGKQPFHAAAQDYLPHRSDRNNQRSRYRADEDLPEGKPLSELTDPNLEKITIKQWDEEVFGSFISQYSQERVHQPFSDRLSDRNCQ